MTYVRRLESEICEAEPKCFGRSEIHYQSCSRTVNRQGVVPSRYWIQLKARREAASVRKANSWEHIRLPYRKKLDVKLTDRIVDPEKVTQHTADRDEKKDCDQNFVPSSETVMVYNTWTLTNGHPRSSNLTR